MEDKCATKKKRIFVPTTPTKTSVISSNPLSSTPHQIPKSNFVDHVRTSTNMMLSMRHLHNFSNDEMEIAVSVVANTLFGRRCKIPLEKSCKSKQSTDDDTDDTLSVTDKDTLPTRSTIRNKLNQMHAMSLSLQAKSEGATLTHATDTTTRKNVGASAGVHVNKNEYLPLPILNMSSETTANIASGIQKETNFLYSTIDVVHMSDSTAHNKGISTVAEELMSRPDLQASTFVTLARLLGLTVVLNQLFTKLRRQ